MYAQVQILFNGSVDLLDEFKQFLPDTSGNQTPASAALFGRLKVVSRLVGLMSFCNVFFFPSIDLDHGSPPGMGVAKKKRNPAYADKMAPTSLTKVRKSAHPFS